MQDKLSVNHVVYASAWMFISEECRASNVNMMAAHPEPGSGIFLSVHCHVCHFKDWKPCLIVGLIERHGCGFWTEHVIHG